MKAAKAAFLFFSKLNLRFGGCDQRLSFRQATRTQRLQYLSHQMELKHPAIIADFPLWKDLFITEKLTAFAVVFAALRFS